MLLIVPTWAGGASGELALLGFGDVVLPGLLLVYTRIFDLQHRTGLCSGYFVPASVGYGVGLILTYGALYFQLGGDQVREQTHSLWLLAMIQSFLVCVCSSAGMLFLWAEPVTSAVDTCEMYRPLAVCLCQECTHTLCKQGTSSPKNATEKCPGVEGMLVMFAGAASTAVLDTVHAWDCHAAELVSGGPAGHVAGYRAGGRPCGGALQGTPAQYTGGG